MFGVVKRAVYSMKNNDEEIDSKFLNLKQEMDGVVTWFNCVNASVYAS